MRICTRLFSGVALLLIAACDGPFETPPAAGMPYTSQEQSLTSPKPFLPNWAREDLSWLSGNYRESYAESRAICEVALSAEPTTGDYPSKSEAAALNGCSSADLYFGIGVARNRVKARHCALLEREEYRRMYVEDGIMPYPLLDGSGVLAIIYANGEGAARDFDVAITMACEMAGAPAEMDFRIAELAQKGSAGWQGKDFHVCDHITSGRASGWCQSLETRLTKQGREEAYAKTTMGWPAGQRAAFNAALDTFETYADVANQMNCFRGTAAGMCAIAGSDMMLAEFSERLLAFAETRELPDPTERSEFEAGIAEMSDAATVTEEEWQARHEDFNWGDEWDWYENHRIEAIAARRAFEPKLIAFARIARPDLTSTQVRRLFRDL